MPAKKPLAYPLIDDQIGVSHEILAPPEQRGKGLELGRCRPNVYGLAYAGTALPLPNSYMVAEAEWADRINEHAKAKTNLTALLDMYGLTVLDQSNTSFCWVNAPTHCNEIMNLKGNNALIRLSPASAGARIKNFRNVGGWGQEALQFLATNGQNTIEEWPANAIQRKYDTPENEALAKRRVVTEWYELEPGNVPQLISLLLHRIPVAVGYNWWGHEVTAVEAAWVNGAIAILIDNSWGLSWGTKGRGYLQGRKMRPDDAVAALVPMAA